jgi:Family of unknown function (DUF5895)
MTYSKTRATKDHTAEYLSTPDRAPSSVSASERSEASIGERNITPPATDREITVPSAAEVKDRFAAPEYVNPNARLPRIQALRGENGPSECGYFITETEMAKAGWGHVDENELIVYEYSSGGKERGLLIKSPRMLVVPRSPLFAFDRQISRQEERLVVAGQYNKQLYSDRARGGGNVLSRLLGALPWSGNPTGAHPQTVGKPDVRGASRNEKRDPLTQTHAVGVGEASP